MDLLEIVHRERPIEYNEAIYVIGCYIKIRKGVSIKISYHKMNPFEVSMACDMATYAIHWLRDNKEEWIYDW